jgi:hypothetical protein
MAPEQPDIEVIAQFPGAYSLARLNWAGGQVTFQEIVGDAVDAATISAAMQHPIPGSLISSCWEQASALGGPGWVHVYEAA